MDPDVGAQLYLIIHTTGSQLYLIIHTSCRRSCNLCSDCGPPLSVAGGVDPWTLVPMKLPSAGGSVGSDSERLPAEKADEYSSDRIVLSAVRLYTLDHGACLAAHRRKRPICRDGLAAATRDERTNLSRRWRAHQRWSASDYIERSLSCARRAKAATPTKWATCRATRTRHVESASERRTFK